MSIYGASVEIGGKLMCRSDSDINSPKFAEFDSLDDNELVEISRAGTPALGKRAVATLISRYRRLVRKRADGCAGGYAEPEDLAQEGFLSFLNAVNTFDVSRGAKFSSFADVCVTNGIRSAAMRLEKNAGAALAEETRGGAEDKSSPESIWFEKEKTLALCNEIRSLLSKREWNIFSLYLGGLSYREIAERLDISVKSVDNAVFRVRKKLRILFSPDNSDI